MTTAPRAPGATRPAVSPAPLPDISATITPSLWKTGAPAPRPRAMLGPVETRSVSPVFVGRTQELAVLNEALARAAAGEPQALLLAGEAGHRLGLFPARAQDPVAAGQ